jgi:hypothetical protein
MQEVMFKKKMLSASWGELGGILRDDTGEMEEVGALGEVDEGGSRFGCRCLLFWLVLGTHRWSLVRAL